MFLSVLLKRASGVLGMLRGSDNDAAIVTKAGRIPTVANYDTVMNVAAAAAGVVTITPPAGELWRVKNLYVFLARPTGSGSGTHEIGVLAIGTDASKDRFLFAKSNFGDSILIRGGMIETATSSKIPTDEAAQAIKLQSIIATPTTPISIYYYNATDATQTGTMAVRLSREVEYLS